MNVIISPQTVGIADRSFRNATEKARFDVRGVVHLHEECRFPARRPRILIGHFFRQAPQVFCQA